MAFVPKSGSGFFGSRPGTTAWGGRATRRRVFMLSLQGVTRDCDFQVEIIALP